MNHYIRYFRYGDQAVDDHGWGCVYRNIQTACWKAFQQAPDIERMKAWFGLSGQRGTNLWIEPIDAMSFLQNQMQLSCDHYFVARGTTRTTAFKRTSLESMIRDAVTILDLNEILRMLFSGTDGPTASCIIDNGTYSYVLLGCRVDAETSALWFRRADPHCQAGDRQQGVRWMQSEEVWGDSCSWSVCTVCWP